MRSLSLLGCILFAVGGARRYLALKRLTGLVVHVVLLLGVAALAQRLDMNRFVPDRVEQNGAENLNGYPGRNLAKLKLLGYKLQLLHGCRGLDLLPYAHTPSIRGATPF